jgi:hypothetical protein
LKCDCKTCDDTWTTSAVWQDSMHHLLHGRANRHISEQWWMHLSRVSRLMSAWHSPHKDVKTCLMKDMALKLHCRGCPTFATTALQLTNSGADMYERSLGHIPETKGYTMGLLMWWRGPQGHIYSKSCDQPSHPNMTRTYKPPTTAPRRLAGDPMRTVDYH